LGVCLACALEPGRGAGGEPALEAERVYVIRKHDTLSRIGREHGVSVKDLAKHNRILPADKIYEGQRLRIPSAPKPTEAKEGGLPAEVIAAIDKAEVVAGRWQHVVIHHSGTESGTLKGIDEYHRDRRRMEHGLAYHFVVGNGHGMPDGEIAVGTRWTEQLDGGHLASAELNQASLGICLIGHFDRQKPTAQQWASLKALLRALLARCQLELEAVKTHQQINPIHTRCPGRRFDTKLLLRELEGDGGPAGPPAAP